MNAKRTWLAVILLSASVLFAQTEKATLRGMVADPSGAVVPNATVVLTEMATNVEARRVTTDSNGNYEMPDLKPTTYRVRIDQAGFRSYVAAGVLLDPSQPRRLDITLQMGATSESITVEAGASLIQTESGSLSGQIDTTKRWNDAPVVDVYPSPLGLLVTTPGIQGNGWNIVMSGITDRQKQTWALDGVANDTTGDQNDNPNFFRTVEVTPVNGGADSARAASFNMVSKQGANEFHGAAYYKHENSALNARSFFDFNRKKTPMILHEMEGEAGGRIIRNRTFFYVGWMYQKIPLGTYLNASMPTDLMRSGDFTQTNKTIKDPTTGLPFPNNAVPQNRFSPVSVALLNLYYPKQNIGGATTFSNNYGWTHAYNQELYKGNWPFVRIDHKLTNNDNLYVRWMVRKTPYIWAAAAGELYNNTQYRDHRGTVVSETHVFSSNLINTFTFGHTTDFLQQGEPEKTVTPLFGDDVVKSIGLLGTNQQGAHTMAFPSMAVSGLTTLTLRNAGGNTNNVTTNDGINTFEDTATWAKGKHVFKFGAEVRHFWRYSGAVSQDVYGNFNFNGTFTNHAFADFLLGIPYTSTRVNALVDRRSHQNQLGFFANDTFKVGKKLTIDYGVRWDYYASPLYDDGLMFNWDQATANILVAPGTLSKVSPFYPRSLINVVEGNVAPSPTLRNFRPRLSAAYRITDKMVLRGGYGEFTSTYGYFFGLLSGGPFQVSESYNNTVTNGVPAFTFPNPFPGSTASAAAPGQSATAVPMNMTNGVLRQYNVTLERQVGNLGLRASFIGTRGGGMLYSLNIDKPQASTIPFTVSRRPWPQFTGTTVYRTDGVWHYDSLQLEVQKRAGPLTFNSSFTWANNISNYSNTQDPYNVTNKWTRDGSDRRLYFVTSATWEVPMGKGRRFFSTAPAVVNGVLGGWTSQAIVTLASPLYFSPAFSGSDPSNTNTSGGLPDCTGDPYSTPQTLNQWFNPKAISIPASGHYGNCGVNSLKGYPIKVAHLSLAKTFHITERLKTTFTAQVSDLANHPHFNNPNNNISNANPGMFTSAVANYNPEKQGYRQIDLKLRIEF